MITKQDFKLIKETLQTYNGVVELLYLPKGTWYTNVQLTKVKTDKGWVDGLIYSETLRSDKYVRPLTKFDDKWEVIYKGVPLLREMSHIVEKALAELDTMTPEDFRQECILAGYTPVDKED